MRGGLSSPGETNADELKRSVLESPQMAGCDLASQAGSEASGGWSEPLDAWWPASPTQEGPPCRVVAIDCGAKRNIYRHLVSAGCEVRVVPAGTSAEEIRGLDPEGIFISNGPGDPAAVGSVIEALKELMGQVPMFGICLGHQLLALALGASTWKLPFGHRGANQPVRDLEEDRIYITSQNHGFCVDAEGLEAAGCVITHEHLNDGTVAGFRHQSLPVRGVQFHPEASPGPHEAAALFRWFADAMRQNRAGTAVAGGAGEDYRTSS